MRTIPDLLRFTSLGGAVVAAPVVVVLLPEISLGMATVLLGLCVGVAGVALMGTPE